MEKLLSQDHLLRKAYRYQKITITNVLLNRIQGQNGKVKFVTLSGRVQFAVVLTKAKYGHNVFLYQCVRGPTSAGGGVAEGLRWAGGRRQGWLGGTATTDRQYTSCTRPSDVVSSVSAQQWRTNRASAFVTFLRTNLTHRKVAPSAVLYFRSDWL